MTAKHTPGPWTLREFEDGGKIIRVVKDSAGGLIWNSRRRNQGGTARLIMAAPDLLAALQEILPLFRSAFDEDARRDYKLDPVIDRAAAAIASAIGGWES